MTEKRKSNFEWLRVLAMGMIISLHYMFKGSVVLPMTQDTSLANLIMWLITYACLPAVNVYVLISGYFLVETEFRFRRLIDLCIQVLEYSIIVTVVMVVSGQITLNSLSFYDWLGFIFPIGTEEYWFITAYILMYILTPVLGAGAKALSEKKLRIAVILMLAITSLEKTIMPYYLPTDRNGYEYGWFIVMFLVAAYIRLYGLSWLEGHIVRSWIVYVVSVVLSFAFSIGCSIAETKTGIETFGHFVDITVDYNFLLTFTAAIGLFYVFRNSQFNEEKKTADIGRLLGGLTFGIYLLHEHPLIRYEWPVWCNVTRDRLPVFIVLHLLLCVLIIFTIGAIVEWLRSRIHRIK